MMTGSFLSRRLTRLLTALCLLTGTAFAATEAPSRTAAASLHSYYLQHRAALNDAEFGLPLQLSSTIHDDVAQGEVLAVLDTPYPILATNLSQTDAWCELAILHVNVKSCVHSATGLQLYLGRKEYQAPDQAREIHYAFAIPSHTANYLQVRMTAPQGPLGTHDYLISLEAMALDEAHSLIRLRYRYGFGTLARLAMHAYLATAGRNKVGFTISGHDQQGQAIYVKGMQGVVERNVMRYLLAIQSLLDKHTRRIAGDKQSQFKQWYRYTAQYPRQLTELSREDYLRNKQREWQNQRDLQADLQLATQQPRLYY